MSISKERRFDQNLTDSGESRSKKRARMGAPIMYAELSYFFTGSRRSYRSSLSGWRSKGDNTVLRHQCRIAGYWV